MEINNEEFNIKQFAEKAIEEKLDKWFQEQLNTDYYAPRNSLKENIHRLITEKFVERFVTENYTDLVSRLDTDKLIKLIEAKAAIRLVATGKE